jgi:hypothetical protein
MEKPTLRRDSLVRMIVSVLSTMALISVLLATVMVTL